MFADKKREQNLLSVRRKAVILQPIWSIPCWKAQKLRSVKVFFQYKV